jgi:hypothetical protein
LFEERLEFINQILVFVLIDIGQVVNLLFIWLLFASKELGSVEQG